MPSLTFVFLLWLALFCSNFKAAPPSASSTTTTPAAAASKAATTSTTTAPAAAASKPATTSTATTATTPAAASKAATTSTTTAPAAAASKPATTSTATTTTTPAASSKAATTTTTSSTTTTPAAAASKAATTSTTTTATTTTPAAAPKATTTTAPPTLAPLVLDAAGMPKACPTIERRREIRTLNPTELKQYIEDTIKYRASASFAESVKNHHMNSNFIHGKTSNIFLIWHRYYTFDHECRVSNVLGRRFVQPYWCWACNDDYGDAANSDVITKLGLGGDGDRQGSFYEFYNMVDLTTNGTYSNPTTPLNVVKGFCLKDGAFNASFAPYPFKSCILRNFNVGGAGSGKMAPLSSMMTINGLMEYDKLSDFRTNLENVVHAGTHNAMGGHMRSMNSPSDHFFFLHHAFLDLVFSYWQDLKSNYKAVQEQPDASNPSFSGDISNQKMYPFAVTCGKVMKIKDLCYSYDDYTVAPPASSNTGSVSPGRTFIPLVNDTAHTVMSITPSGTVKRRAVDPLAEKQQQQNQTIKNIVQACYSLKVNTSRSVVAAFQPPLLVAYNPRIQLVPLLDGRLPKGYVDIGSAPVPLRVDDFWIRLNNLNREAVEKTYNQQVDLLYKVNSVPGYIPPGSPWHCNHQMDILYKSSKTLCIVVNGTAIASHAANRDLNDPNGVNLIKAYMLNSIISDDYWKPVSEVASLLIPVMGRPYTKNVNSAFNPYAPRFASEVGFSRGDFGTARKVTYKDVQALVRKRLKENANLRREEPVVNLKVVEARTNYYQLKKGSDGNNGGVLL